jgi:selenocysteine insertion sequence-binding protein 2
LRGLEEFHNKVDEDKVESKGDEEKIPVESDTNPMTQSDKWTATEAKEETKHIVTEEERAKEKIHSRRFRHYCSQLLTPELDALAMVLMGDLVRFQDKQHAKDPVKAKARRRYVVGLRETGKFLGVHKVSCLLLAPDLEKVEATGGLDDAVTGLLAAAARQEPPVPVVFALNRRKLGRACLRKVPVSCVGVMNPQVFNQRQRQC